MTESVSFQSNAGGGAVQFLLFDGRPGVAGAHEERVWTGTGNTSTAKPKIEGGPPDLTEDRRGITRLNEIGKVERHLGYRPAQRLVPLGFLKNYLKSPAKVNDKVNMRVPVRPPSVDKFG
ncbi:hypothetical protein PoB_002972700 [Plakobranchus ocellatus]|uniref:Uncharacterized protein n=1 Tax=Plakobranchus ocellatus TaxID=259542 RepID=A0AAV4A8M0_9GAST|nr:hypothetical protein PoB_002972700 [Plakobranchus ocellatus]